MSDALGTEFKVGDIITYPGRTGSSLWMNFAVIESIQINKHHYKDWENVTTLKVSAICDKEYDHEQYQLEFPRPENKDNSDWRIRQEWSVEWLKNRHNYELPQKLRATTITCTNRAVIINESYKLDDVLSQRRNALVNFEKYAALDKSDWKLLSYLGNDTKISVNVQYENDEYFYGDNGARWKKDQWIKIAENIK